MLPFPQAFAFFQNASLMGSGDEGDLRAVIQKSWRQASLWPMQNTLILWLTSPFLLGVAAFLVFVIVPISSSFSPDAPISFLLVIAALVVIPLCPLGMVTALNIGIAVLLFPWLLKTFFRGLEPTLLVAVLGYLAWINLALGVFNLIPGFPLDGGRVFRGKGCVPFESLPAAAAGRARPAQPARAGVALRANAV